MITPRLQEDLLREHRTEREFIVQQIDRLDPVANTLRQPAAARVASSGLILFGELLCYLLALALVAGAIFSDKIYPLLLFTRFKRPEYTELIRPANVNNLYWGMIVALIAGAVLLYLIARALSRVRHKNAMLARAGSTLKNLLGDLLKRKAALDALEQRHASELAALPATTTTTDVNEVRNPGYDEGSLNRSFDR